MSLSRKSIVVPAAKEDVCTDWGYNKVLNMIWARKGECCKIFCDEIGDRYCCITTGVINCLEYELTPTGNCETTISVRFGTSKACWYYIVARAVVLMERKQTRSAEVKKQKWILEEARNWMLRNRRDSEAAHEAEEKFSMLSYHYVSITRIQWFQVEDLCPDIYNVCKHLNIL